MRMRAAGGLFPELRSASDLTGLSLSLIFPDAPTLRGKRHVEELAQIAREGQRATILFIIQRSDATALTPHDDTDPAFGKALRLAASQGVEIYAYRCRVTPSQVTITDAVPIRL